jgi:hypothetical protein
MHDKCPSFYYVNNIYVGNIETAKAMGVINGKT